MFNRTKTSLNLTPARKQLEGLIATRRNMSSSLVSLRARANVPFESIEPDIDAADLPEKNLFEAKGEDLAENDILLDDPEQHLTDAEFATRELIRLFIVEFKKLKSTEEVTRLAKNVEAIKTGLDIIFVKKDKTSIEDKINALEKMHYTASKWEYTFAVAKKVVKTIIAAAVGFVLGLVMGAIATGWGGLPAAMYASLQTASLYWGCGGAGFLSLGPVLFAAMSANGALKASTNSPIEAKMVELKNLVARQALPNAISELTQKLKTLELKGEAVRNGINAILTRAEILRKEAESSWLGSISKLDKSVQLCLATEKVLKKLENNSNMSIEEVLNLQVSIQSGKKIINKTYKEFIQTARNPRLDSVRSFFNREPITTKTEELLNSTYNSKPVLGNS